MIAMSHAGAERNEPITAEDGVAETSSTCLAGTGGPTPRRAGAPAAMVARSDAPVATLGDIARRYGTPTYAYDLRRVRAQVAKLRAHLPPAIDILYSLKANASLGLCAAVADTGLGADVASAGELVTALAAGFPPSRLVLTGPDKSPAVLAELR